MADELLKAKSYLPGTKFKVSLSNRIFVGIKVRDSGIHETSLRIEQFYLQPAFAEFVSFPVVNGIKLFNDNNKSFKRCILIKVLLYIFTMVMF